MRSRTTSMVTVVLLALACATVFLRCEESDTYAPSDGTMEMEAIPQTVVIDTEASAPPDPVTIRVQIFDADGFAASGKTVLFSNTAGVLASNASGAGTAGVETDQNGIAIDILTVRPIDPDTIDVTARSGVLTKTVTVTKTELTGEIVVTADTTTFHLDPDNGPTTGVTRVSAQLLNSQGSPVQGAEINFASDGGAFDLANPVVTDALGIARNVLRIDVDDAPSVTVNARRGTVVGELDITIILPGQTPPTAVLTASPAGQAFVDNPVSFSGSGSTDPENDISCYRFTITSSVPASNQVVTQATSTFAATYNAPQNLSVTLLVTDDTPPTFPCADGTVFESFDEATISYGIVCQAPTASAEIDSIDSVGPPFDVVLDGSGSTAPGSTIQEYRWTCNNQAGDIAFGVQATCSYESAGTRTVTLRVKNGNECGAQTATDTVQVTVPAP